MSLDVSVEGEEVLVGKEVLVEGVVIFERIVSTPTWGACVKFV
jgi:hypothetical protein